FGLLGDLRSRRGVITGGVLLWSACTLVSGFAGSFAGLLIARALVGAGGAAFGGAAQSLAADYFPSRGRAVAMGILSAGIALGVAAGGLLAFQLDRVSGADSKIDVAAFGAAVAIGLAFNIRVWVRHFAQGPAAGPHALVRAFGDLAESLAVVLRTPTLVYVFL